MRGATGTVPAGLVEAVAERTAEYPFRAWGFGEGMALHGLLLAGERLGRADLVDRVADLVAPTLHRAASPLDHLVAVDVLVELARLRPALDVSDAVSRFGRAVLDAARPVPGRPAVHRPDLPGLDGTVWVDCLHTDGPGLTATVGRDRAAAQVESAAGALASPGGLFSHGYDVRTGSANDVHWGRGQGWALHGLLAVGSPRLEPLLAALAVHELEGSWRTVVDDPGAPVEHSVSALVAAGVLEGVAGGRLAHRWRAMGERALAAAVAAVDAEGGLPVSSATPVGTHASYLDRDLGVFPWGQGPLLLALLHEEEAA